MPALLTPTQRDIILRHLTEGVVLEDQKGVLPTTVRDVGIAQHVFELLNQDPTLDVRRTIRSMINISEVSVRRIQEIVDLFIDHTSTMTRQRAQFIVEKKSIDLIRTGEITGDWHSQQAGLKNLIAVHHLDQPEEEKDHVKETWLVPMVLAPVESVGPDKHSLTEEQKQALFKKYGAKEDDMQLLIKEKVAIRRAQYGTENQEKQMPIDSEGEAD